MRPFISKFPKLGEKETRVVTVPQKGVYGSLPPDEYALVESYCDDKGCDCRRVVISVHAHKADRTLATINMGFDPDGEEPGPFLDPLNTQSKYSADLMQMFLDVINTDSKYVVRLQRHYVMFKEKVDGKPYAGKPFKTQGKTKRVVMDPAPLGPVDRKPAVRKEPKVGRNKPCPCGSGKKYKKCCMLKSQKGDAGKGAKETTQPEKVSRISGKPDDRQNIPGPPLTSKEIKETKALVKRVEGRLKRDTQGRLIDEGIKDALEANPRIGFALLDLLLKVHAPNGRVQEKGKGYEACLFLLEEALTQIRYSVDRNRQWAIDTAERIQKEIAGKAFQLSVDIRVQADLVEALYNAGLQLHPEIKTKSEDIDRHYSRFTTRTGPPDIDRLFDTIVADGPDDPFQLHKRLMAELNLLPIEGQLGVIADMATTRNPMIRELAAFMLLHPNREVRTRVPTIFSQLVSPSTIAPVTLRRMIVLRNWLPEIERPALDQVIKNMRIARVGCAPMPPVQSVETYATPFDGSGIQGAWVFGRQKSRYHLGGVLVRQGQGIRDAWGVSSMTKKEVKSMVKEVSQGGMAKQVEPAYLERLVSHFIWLGQQQDNPPPPELLQVAEAMGSADWHPKPLVFEKELAALEETPDMRSLTSEDIAGILEKSGDWPEKMEFASSWFEDDAHVDDVIKKRTDLPLPSREFLLEASTLIIEEILEKKRDVWSERLLWMALWTRSCKSRRRLPWQDFCVVARDLWQGAPPGENPLMIAVAVRSVLSALRRMKDMPS
ncbi:MAG: hypothetical protein BA865_01910 [Desulfobacterales bacterium S5133MH4]|nr:MAG: hypothetical protein BA865_01910 [Desulfobacterales bacterium S5133MH4]